MLKRIEGLDLEYQRKVQLAKEGPVEQRAARIRAAKEARWRKTPRAAKEFKPWPPTETLLDLAWSSLKTERTVVAGMGGAVYLPLAESTVLGWCRRHGLGWLATRRLMYQIRQLESWTDAHQAAMRERAKADD